MKRNFRTHHDRERVVSKPGSRFVPKYKLAYNDENIVDLVPDGEYNLYEQIQSHKDSVDINVIIKRFLSGDTSVLERSSGMYLDLTQFPTTYAQFQQQVIDAKNLFDGLPLEVKEKFDFSADKFYASVGSDEFFENLGISKPVPVVNVENTLEEGELNE